jgi:hypothetical protein
MKISARVLLKVLFLLILTPLTVEANDEINIKQAIISIQVEKKALISNNIKLTNEESRNFWPIYDDYQEALNRTADRTRKLIRDYSKAWESMPDKTAKAMLKEFLDIHTEKLKNMKSFVKKFNGVLPPRKVLKYFQLENKVEAGTNYEFASHIPLVK